MNAPNELKVRKDLQKTQWANGDDAISGTTLPIASDQPAHDFAGRAGNDDAFEAAGAETPVDLANTMIDWWSLPVTDPAATARSTIQWWTTQMEKAGEQFRQAPMPQGKATDR